MLRPFDTSWIAVDRIVDDLMKKVNDTFKHTLAERGEIIDPVIYQGLLASYRERLKARTLQELYTVESQVMRWIHDAMEEYAKPSYEPQSHKLRVFNK